MKAFVSRVSKILCFVLPLSGCAVRPDSASPADALASRPIAELADGDLIFPRFSPDGRVLAYSEVIVGEEGENTRLLLYDLGTGETTVLLDKETAMGYGVYSSFVTNLRWKDNRYLEATLHDGDVELTWLTLDVVSRKVVREEPSGDEGASLREPFPGLGELPDDALALFPEDPKDLALSLDWDPVAVPGRGVIFQTSAEGESGPVFWIDFRAKTSIPLLPAGSGELRGGSSLGDSAFFLVNKGNAGLFLLQEGEARKLVELPSTQLDLGFAPLTRGRALLMIRTRPLREVGENPLFYWDGKTLTRIQGPENLVDLHGHPATGRVAFCSWNGGRRRITVHQLR